MKRIVALALTVLLPLSSIFYAGCAQSADGRKTQAQGTAIGAVGGAILGGLLGAATGNRSNIARFAAVGAAAGGAAGFAYGTAVAKRKAQYARAEAWLDSEIALARQANGRAYAYNRSLRSRIASLEARARAARAAGNRSQLNAIKGEIAQVQKDAANVQVQEDQSLNEQKEVLNDAQARSAANYGAYQREANSFSQARSERGQLLGRLASLDNSIDR